MAKEILKDAGVKVNSVDLSSQVQSVTLTYEAAAQDTTAMGDDTVINLAGLLNWSVQVTFYQDFSSSNVDDTLFSLVGAAAFEIKIIKDSSSSVGSSNPLFSGNVILESYPPFGNSIGEVATVQATFQSAGTLSRATSGTF